MTDRGCCEDLPEYTGAVCIADTCDECWDNWNARKGSVMTDKFKQIEKQYQVCRDAYEQGTVNTMHIDDIQWLVDEVKRLNSHMARIHYLVQYDMLPEEDVLDGVKPSHSNLDIVIMVDKEVSEARGTEDA